MAEGRLSFSQVRALTRAPAEDEAELLEHARGLRASELERLVRSWRRLGRVEEEAQEERIHRARTLSIFPDDEGAYVIRGKLEPEAGALLMRAIEWASDALYRGSVPETTPEQRRADALAVNCTLARAGARACSFDLAIRGEPCTHPESGDHVCSFDLAIRGKACMGVDRTGRVVR